MQHEMRIYTSAKWSGLCRNMCVELYMENGSPIGGDDIEVAIDETNIYLYYMKDVLIM